ncbi:MAG: RAD55 family ATPase [Synergistaceae bacterium]|nr:RAD55 family ATPase [Synergistaceae bacterium]
MRSHLIEIQYSHLLQEEHKTPEEASRILLYSARGLLSPPKIRRAISRGKLLSKRPESAKQFKDEAKGARHRTELEQALRNRHNLTPVTFGIDELDALIPGGITAGEVLHIVGGEGGLKTSLLLHILCNYAKQGGQALFFSLDMPPETIELRRFMRIMDCGRERAKEHIKYDTEEYRRARELLEEQDENLSVMGGPLGLGKMQAAILVSGADLVAIDYVTLVDGHKNELDTAREVTRAVRNWRKTWGITFILLSQMSRESKRDAFQGGTGGHGIGGSSLEQLVDYELELMKDEPLGNGGNPRLIATLRKNRAGQSGVSFEIFPCFPSLTFTGRAERVERDRKRKALFSEYLTGRTV